MGTIESEIRSLERFTHLAVSGRVNVTLIQDTLNYAEIIYGEHVTHGIRTEVEGETLRVYEVNQCDWMRNLSIWPEVRLHTTALSSIYSQSSGEIISSNALTSPNFNYEVYEVAGSTSLWFEGDSIRVYLHTGANDITLKGTADYGYFYAAAYSPIQASDLILKEAVPHNNGVGDIYLNATDIVYYQIFDDGNIYVHGNPKLKKWHKEGNGEIILVN